MVIKTYDEQTMAIRTGVTGRWQRQH